MKLELEQADIQAIARDVTSEVLKALMPILDGKGAKDAIFTIEDLCEYLHVEKGWVYQQVHSKTIPYLKAGKHLRFRKTDIDKYLTNNCK